MTGASRLRAVAHHAVSCLVMAKAPVAGEAKTRLGASIGMSAAAEVAAAALLDTLEVCSAAFPGRCTLALSGDLARAARGAELSAAVARWSVTPQQGTGFGERLAAAHASMAGPVVQIGMDTPQVTVDLLHKAAEALSAHDAVLGPAPDGGWWVLGLRDPRHAQVLTEVPMSTADTFERTLAALRGEGLHVGVTETARDVDEVADARLVAAEAPHTRFARAWLAARSDREHP